MEKRKKPAWDADSVRGLRLHMELTQQQLAEVLGVRQQTVSEWETGAYQPRGASDRVLGMVADDAGFAYDADLAHDADRPPEAKKGDGTPRRRAP